jgi:hypothetical protein
MTSPIGRSWRGYRRLRTLKRCTRFGSPLGS